MDSAIARDVAALEDTLVEQFAPAVTQWSFGSFLLTGHAYWPSKEAGISAAKRDVGKYNQGSANYFVDAICRDSTVPIVERLLFRMLGTRIIVPLMIESNNITAARRDEALTNIRRVLAQIDQLLIDPSRPEKPLPPSTSNSYLHSTTSPFENEKDLPRGFLFGTARPTSADITFASFCLPLLLPEETRGLFPSMKDLQAFLEKARVHRDSDASFAGIVRFTETAQQLLEEHRSARYALALYRTYRS
jgi:hypothetical protein